MEEEVVRKQRKKPPTSPEARENVMIGLAVDLAEKQLREGKASSQVICHYLKLGSTKERLEREIMEQQRDLMAAKTDAIKASQDAKEEYLAAIKAMGIYSGAESEDDDDEAY